MSGYGYTFESEGTAALQPQEHPYLRLVTDVDLDDDLFVLQRDDCTAESASRPLVEPFDSQSYEDLLGCSLFVLMPYGGHDVLRPYQRESSFEPR